MTDQFENNDDEGPTGNAAASRVRQRGSMAFPYADLDEAIRIARAVHSNGKRLTFDQLAPRIGHKTVKSGGFRSKVSAARLFDVVGINGNIVSLTPLGSRVIDPRQESRARVEAFLSVELFRTLYEEFRGELMPGGPGIEQRMLDLGVAPNQKERARQVFLRSAEQAGFFNQGPDRLVEPTASDERPQPNRGTIIQSMAPPVATALTGPIPSEVQPLLMLLLTEGESWPEDRQQALLQQIRDTYRLLRFTGDSVATEPDED